MTLRRPPDLPAIGTFFFSGEPAMKGDLAVLNLGGQAIDGFIRDQDALTYLQVP
jgi:hypothetical protein